MQENTWSVVLRKLSFTICFTAFVAGLEFDCKTVMQHLGRGESMNWRTDHLDSTVNKK